jgi:hypothetical protein
VFTVPFVRHPRGAGMDVAIDSVFTLLVTGAAAVGALLARRQRAAVRP